MRITFVLAILSVVAVAVHCNLCQNDDPTACTHTCPSGEAKACEHRVCTCAKMCVQASDCPECPSHSGPNGEIVHEIKHCIDGACLCFPEHMQPGPGGHHP